MSRKRLEEQSVDTHYANTDLEIEADREPIALTAVFHQHEFFTLTERTKEDGSWHGSYETNDQYGEPDANITGFLDIIERLEGAALEAWQKCSRREFDIGYMAGYEPFNFTQMITLETLRRVVNAGAVIRITVYAAEPKPVPASTE